MSKLDENLESLHRKVDAYLEQLALKERDAAEPARSTEPALGMPNQGEDTESTDGSASRLISLGFPNPSKSPARQPTEPIEPIGASTEFTPSTADSDKEPTLKPKNNPVYQAPQPLPVEQSSPLLRENQHTVVDSRANDEDRKVPLGFFGKIFSRLRWW